MTDEELLKVFEEEKTDEMVIDELKEDLFNIYILLEMENILMDDFFMRAWRWRKNSKKSPISSVKWRKKFITNGNKCSEQTLMAGDENHAGT